MIIVLFVYFNVFFFCTSLNRAEQTAFCILLWLPTFFVQLRSQIYSAYILRELPVFRWPLREHFRPFPLHLLFSPLFLSVDYPTLLTTFIKYNISKWPEQKRSQLPRHQPRRLPSSQERDRSQERRVGLHTSTRC